jgi:hypothetical protein
MFLKNNKLGVLKSAQIPHLSPHFFVVFARHVTGFFCGSINVFLREAEHKLWHPTHGSVSRCYARHAGSQNNARFPDPYKSDETLSTRYHAGYLRPDLCGRVFIFYRAIHLRRM